MLVQLNRNQWSERRRKATDRRDRIATQHLDLVKRIARQVQRGMTHIQVEDLEGAGYMGLLEAASRYTRGKGNFEHFAYFRIRGAMYDAHKRAAYRDETHDSVEGMQEQFGFLPAFLDRDDTGMAPDEVAAQREQARLLAEAVKELPDDEQYIFMRTLQGQPLTKIAEECDRSIAWVRAKLAIARCQLGARVISWGIGIAA